MDFESQRYRQRPVENLTHDEDTQDSTEEDAVLCSQADRRCLAGWQSWRNNIAWRDTWLSMKISEIEEELDRVHRLKAEPVKNNHDPIYLPAYPTLKDHPFLSLQVPKKRALMSPTILQPYKRSRTSRNKEKREKAKEKENIEKSLKTSTSQLEQPEILDSRRLPARRFTSTRKRDGDFHDDKFHFNLSNFWEMPGSHSDGRTVIFENPEIEIPPIRVVEESPVNSLHQDPIIPQDDSIATHSLKPNPTGQGPGKGSPAEECAGKEDPALKFDGVSLANDNINVDDFSTEEEEEPTDHVFTLRHYRLECLERYKNRPALAIFPSANGRSGVPDENEFVFTHWYQTYTAAPPPPRRTGEWPVAEVRHYEVNVPTIAIQDDLLFVREDRDSHESKGRKKKDKHKSKHKKRNLIHKPSIVDSYDWELIPNNEGDKKSLIRFRRLPLMENGNAINI